MQEKADMRKREIHVRGAYDLLPLRSDFCRSPCTRRSQMALRALSLFQTGSSAMVNTQDIKAHAEVIGADGVHVGTVDRVEGDRIKLTRDDSGEGDGRHHYISMGLVA